MAVSRTLAATVRAVTDHGERVYSVELETSGPVPRFVPGQFLRLAVDPYTPGGFWPESRVFSIASPPDGSQRLAITYAVKGSFTGRMENALAPGRRAWVKLPYGSFTVDPGRDAVLFAGGTGITAFTAFLGALGASHPRRVVLFYGARHDGLFIYRDMLRSLTAKPPGLTVHMIPEDTGGRIDIDRAWDRIGALERPVFYLSGPPQMLSALGGRLRERGIESEAIRTDAWE